MMSYGWEGNRRSSVTLTIDHRLSGLSSYGLNSQGEAHPAYTPLGVW